MDGSLRCRYGHWSPATSSPKTSTERSESPGANPDSTPLHPTPRQVGPACSTTSRSSGPSVPKQPVSPVLPPPTPRPTWPRPHPPCTTKAAGRSSPVPEAPSAEIPGLDRIDPDSLHAGGDQVRDAMPVLDLPFDHQGRRLSGHGPVTLPDIGCDDHIELTGLVLEIEEDHPCGSAGPLAMGHHPSHLRPTRPMHAQHAVDRHATGGVEFLPDELDGMANRDAATPELGPMLLFFAHRRKGRSVRPRCQRQPTRIDLGQSPCRPDALPPAQPDRLQRPGRCQSFESGC